MRYNNKVITIILILIITSCIFAAPVGSGQLFFKGYISPGFYFSVSELNPQIYNLIENLDLQPSGAGVDIGTWTLRVDNPPIEDTLYDISYTYGSLVAEDVEDAIEFSLLEKIEETTIVEEMLSGTTTSVTISGNSELNVVKRILAARLTVEGAIAASLAAASNDYQSNITVSLSTE